MTTPPPDGDRPYGWGPPPPAQPYRPSPFPASGPPADPGRPFPGQAYPGPPFGPPSAAPPQKSYVGLIAGVTALIVLGIAGGTALTLSLRTTVLDPASVERDVAAQFENREGVAVALTCPDDMEVASGEVYECSGTTADGEEVTIEIQIADSLDGAYTWIEP